MKLSEALILRADYQKRIGQVKQRILNYSKVQEGDLVPEAPQTLLAQMEALALEFKRLIKRINKANLATEFAPGISLTDALAERDVLAMRRNVYQELVTTASTRENRYGQSEIRYTVTVDIAQMQKQVDALAKEYRELDMQIQAINWQTELGE